MKPKTPQSSSTQRTLDIFLKKTTSDNVMSTNATVNKRKNPTTDDEQRCPSSSQNSPPDVKRSKREEETTEELLKTPQRAATTNVPSTLTPEQRKLVKEKQALARLKLLSSEYSLVSPTSIGPSWFTEILEQEFKKPYFKNLDKFYSSATSRCTVYPPRNQIFSWTQACDIRDVKVVIIGQDPYHGPNQAHGLCFSVQKGVPSPPSLLNMYKELVQDPGVENFTSVPSHGHLAGWASQGVLLLNAVLTVEASKANSHKDKGWENLTTSVIKWISNNLKNIIFLLWGANAQKIAGVVDKSRHSVLQTVHPSPLSAHRGFFGCRHFSKCNEILVSVGKEPIRWEDLP